MILRSNEQKPDVIRHEVWKISAKGIVTIPREPSYYYIKTNKPGLDEVRITKEMYDRLNFSHGNEFQVKIKVGHYGKFKELLEAEPVIRMEIKQEGFTTMEHTIHPVIKFHAVKNYFGKPIRVTKVEIIECINMRQNVSE